MRTKQDISKYQDEYKKKNYYRCVVLLPKEKEEVLKGHAAMMGESVNAFISRAIKEQLKRDKEKRKAETSEED